MIYQEKFEILESNSSYFASQFEILISGFAEEGEERHNHFRDSLKDFSGEVYLFDTCESSERFDFRIEHYNGDLIEEMTNLSLVPDLENLLNRKHFSGKNICLDITNLKHGILFLLTKLFINFVKPARFFASYTEPTEYKKKNINMLGDSEEFDLYDKIIGSRTPVPGFAKSQSSRDILLIASMGFDCQRLQTIYEDLKPEIMIPVVGFPSFVPGWNITAIKMNYIVLRKSESFDSLISCESASPFEFYELLEEEFQRNNTKFDIYITPLGPRPHCLGAALFASRNKSTYLIYDFPVEKKFRSEHVLKSSIYNLSKYIA